MVPGTGGSDRALAGHGPLRPCRRPERRNLQRRRRQRIRRRRPAADRGWLKARAPLHDVIFALVDGEEGGLRGARAMVADPAFKPLLDRTVLAVNFDMISRSRQERALRRRRLPLPVAEAPARCDCRRRQGHPETGSRFACSEGSGLERPVRPRRISPAEAPLGLFRRRGPPGLPQARAMISRRFPRTFSSAPPPR